MSFCNCPGIQDTAFEVFKQLGFRYVVYAHRRFLSLSIKERNYYVEKYDWNVNTSVPVREQLALPGVLDLKIYVVTSHFNLHKSRGSLLAPKYSEYIQADAALTDVQLDYVLGNGIDVIASEPAILMPPGFGSHRIGDHLEIEYFIRVKTIFGLKQQTLT